MDGPGRDKVKAGDGDALMVSSGRSRSGDDADYFVGGAGDDFIQAGDGDDSVLPGPGRDLVRAGAGDDSVLVKVDRSRDVIACGPGRDRVSYHQGERDPRDVMRDSCERVDVYN